jgi:response regulator RpfG family c-di-GMP phosphodiesterase
MNKTPRILLVDDDEVQLQVIAHAVQSFSDYAVLTATSAATAMPLAEKHQPDVIISDYYMPEEDGFAFCKRVKAHPVLRSSMFILLTSASTVEQRIRGLDIGADDYVTKPFNTEELLSHIRAALRIKAMNDELQADKAKLAQLYKELEDDFIGVISLLSYIIGQRVPGASMRAERAAAMSRWIGERLGLKDEQLKMLEIAAKLHEIGKVNLPDDLLKKPLAQLTDLERNAMSHFPLIGQQTLIGIPRLREVGVYIRHQMENFDGTGGPDRLRQEQIPLPSRILRAVNVVETESTRSNITLEQLTATLARLRGTVLDSHVVQLMIEYLEAIENPSWREGKRQVSVYDLKVGMVIAHDLTTGSGTKLLSEKSTISVSILERILAHHQFDPILNNVYVYDTV